MIKLRRHTSLLLFGIFFFPILFHSIHILWHQKHRYKCNHEAHHKEICYTKAPIDIESISEKENSCPICKYQFPIKDFQGLYLFNSIVPSFTCIFNKKTILHLYKQKGPGKSPRAPPLMKS